VSDFGRVLSHIESIERRDVAKSKRSSERPSGSGFRNFKSELARVIDAAVKAGMARRSVADTLDREARWQADLAGRRQSPRIKRNEVVQAKSRL
jgi:hypothetical protein